MNARTLTHRRAYLNDVLKVAYGDEASYLEAMEKYSEEWWNSPKADVIVKHQLYEEVLLVPFKVLQNSLEKVLKRPVACDEICFKNMELKEEVDQALKLLVEC